MENNVNSSTNPSTRRRHNLGSRGRRPLDAPDKQSGALSDLRLVEIERPQI